LLNLFEQQALNIDLDLLKQQFFNNFLNNINNKIDALDLLNVKFYTNINSYKLDTLLNVTLLSYEEFVTPLLKLTNTRSISFAPLVTNITRKGWEKYIITHPYNDDLFTKNWSLYKGIYNYSNNIASVHNNFIYGSKYPTYFFPIWQTSPYILTKNFIMLDIHTSFATKVIDTMILTKQSVISDIITLTIDYSIIKPISIIYYPIIINDNIAGLFAMSFYWHLLILESLNSLNGDIYIVITYKLKTYTFIANKGIIINDGKNDLHDIKFDNYKRSMQINNLLLNLTIDIYPTQIYYNNYINNTPLIISLSIVLIFLIISLIIYLYDKYIQNLDKALKNEEINKNNKYFNDLIDVKKSYIRYISHELRTPLNIASIGINILESEILLNNNKANCMETIKDIKISYNYATELLSNLLDFDKLQDGKTILYQSNINIIKYIDSIIKPFHNIFKEKNIQLKIDYATELLQKISIQNNEDENEYENIITKNDYIFIDKFKIIRVINNIMINAYKFTSNNKNITIKLRKKYIKNNIPLIKKYVFTDFKITPYDNYTNSILIISIIDEGVGLEKNQIDKIFKEVIQFNPNELQAGKGSGLGLMICKGIIDLHKGIIGVSSEGIGKGSIFFIELPLSEKYEETTIKIEEESIIKIEESIIKIEEETIIKIEEEIGEKNKEEINDKLHLLIVDDSELCRKMLCKILIMKKCICSEAKNGLEAVELIKKLNSNNLKYDAILIDYMMPQMDGPTATNNIRNIGYIKPIIGITGNALQVDIEHFIKNGADHVVLKPINTMEIDKILKIIKNFNIV
jgi:signal transduction histidine kinase/CheY-like chemotaxis protein